MVRKFLLGFGVLVIIAHMVAIIFIDDFPYYQSGLRGSAWGSRELAMTGMGKLVYVLFDLFFIFVLLRMIRGNK